MTVRDARPTLPISLVVKPGEAASMKAYVEDLADGGVLHLALLMEQLVKDWPLTELAEIEGLPA